MVNQNDTTPKKSAGGKSRAAPASKAKKVPDVCPAPRSPYFGSKTPACVAWHRKYQPESPFCHNGELDAEQEKLVSEAAEKL